MAFRRLNGSGTLTDPTATGNETNNQASATVVAPGQGPNARALPRPRGNPALQRQLITALREQRRAAGVPDDSPPVGISEMLQGVTEPVRNTGGTSLEAMNFIRQEVAGVKDDPAPRRSSFGYEPDFQLAKKTASSRRERIISLAYDRFRRHLAFPPGQRPVLSPTSKNLEAHAIALTRLTAKEKADIYPYLEPEWRAGIVGSLSEDDKAALTHDLSVQRKSRDAPIKDLSWDDAEKALQTLKGNLDYWNPDFDSNAVKDSGILDKVPEELSERELAAMRLYHTHKILKYMIEMRPSFRAVYSPSAIFFDGVPFGVMLLTNQRDPPSVGCLVTHPGSTHAGGALIEHAVNTSAAWDRNGRIQLLADNPAAMSAYRAMGFETVEETRMMLDPATSDKWQQVDGKWRLTAHIDDKFLVCFGAPLMDDGT